MPPCPLRTLTGVPCPFCGMTRGALALVHGNVFGSLALNPGIVVLALVAIAALVMVVVRGSPRIALPTWLPFAVVIALWSFQLFKYATNRPL
jgi:Protein of unknown function (DUF2752)